MAQIELSQLVVGLLRHRVARILCDISNRRLVVDPSGRVDAGRYLSSKFPAFRDGRRVNTSEDQAAAGTATISDKRTGQSQDLLVSMIARGNQAFVVSGLGKTALPNREFLNVVKSVRRLKRNEQELAQGRKIKLVKARRGDTIASLARKSNLSTYAEAQIRLINNLYPTGQPKPGQMIKIIK